MSPIVVFVLTFFGGVFGTAAAITVSFFVIRSFINRALDNFVKDAHESGQCPMCKGPMKHEHMEG